MFEILDGLKAAFWLVVTLDPTLWEISLRSLRVTLSATHTEKQLEQLLDAFDKII